MARTRGNGMIVGIDLGTTRTGVAHVVGGDPELIENASGNSLTPSVVQVTEEGTVVVGSKAQEKAVLHPDRTITEIKRQMGQETTVEAGGDRYRPEEVSALVLEKVINDAEERLGGEIDQAVVTVPAYFTSRQRTATHNAAEIAGIDVELLLPEPSAAVLAYGHTQQKLGERANETIFVYDLGGGTFDATLVNAEYEHELIETILTDGDTELGGSDWTKAIEEWMIDAVMTDTGVQITDDQKFAEPRRRIRSAAREAKHELTHKRETVINVPFLLPEDGYSFERRLDRETFAELTRPLLNRTRKTIEHLLAEANYTSDDVDTILLAGGASRMPQVESMLELYFGQPPAKRINPDEAIALGAAVQASIRSTDETDTGAVTGGISDEGTDTGAGDDAVHEGVVLTDVLPQTLGVELNDGRFSPVIERGADLPTTVRKEDYSTNHPNHTNVRAQVRQGESPRAADNEFLGEVWIRDIPPRDPTKTTLAVEFTMTRDGTLEVEVEDLLTGKQATGTIESGIRLSPEEINEMSETLPSVE